MLILDNIVVRYGGLEALKGISMQAEQGTITTLIGANGAGKSTCLRAISGLEPLAGGEIRFEDERIDGLSPERIAKLGIAHVPEGRRLFPNMSVYDNLMTGSYLRNDTEGIKKDIETIYESFPVLKERRRQLGKRLSGGEQQMVAIGRGVLADPKLILFDEPSMGLAPLIVKEVGIYIRRLSESGYSIILVEQNANLALGLADKAYVLETGNIVLEGTGEQLKDDDYIRKSYLGI